MSVQLRTLADASLTVAVSRAAPGDLAEGVESKLRRVEGVESVDDLELDGLQPGLNDLTAEVTATLSVDPAVADDPATLAAHLEDRFAVEAAHVEAVRDAPADASEARRDSPADPPDAGREDRADAD
jgi:hypothetical protein